MSSIKPDLLKLAGFALTGIAATACGIPALLALPGAVNEVIKGINTNFAHQFLSGMDYARFKDFLLRPHPDNLNHDLERLMKDALLQAFHHIETMYLDKLENENQYTRLEKIIKRPLKEIKNDFKELRQNLIREEDYQKEFSEKIPEDKKITFSLDKNLRVDQWDDLSLLIDELFKFSESDSDLKTYFVDNLPRIYDLSFKEALKDDRNSKAYKAFQIEALERINFDNKLTHAKIEELNKSLAEIKEQVKQIGSKSCDLAIEQSITSLKNILKVEADRIIYVITSAIKESEQNLKDHIDKKFKLPVIEKHLTQPPFQPEVFLGRDEDLEEIRKILFEESAPLLLLNGKGGIGKTSLASKYYHKFQNEYSHVAWILKEDNIGDGLLSLGHALMLQFEPNQDKNERLEILIRKMAGLAKPCLLIIDNVNKRNDLDDYYETLCRCSNFHIILTTRLKSYAQAKVKNINGLNIETARELFTRYYPQIADEGYENFDKLYEAVDGNTLVIELFSKQLCEINKLRFRKSLEDLIKDIQTKGFLSLDDNKKVQLQYKKFKSATPEEVISALYELQDLNEGERKLITVFSVLPPISIKIETLEILLKEYQNWEEDILVLINSGWLDKNDEDHTLKISPVIQEIVKSKNENLEKDVFQLLEALSYELAFESDSHRIHGLNLNYSETTLYVTFAESLLAFLKSKSIEKLILFRRLAYYYYFYLNNIKSRLYSESVVYELTIFGNEIEFKFIKGSSLIILGNIYQSEGKIQEAMLCYQQQLELIEHLHKNYPEKSTYRYSLAIGYSSLSDYFFDAGKYSEALKYLQKSYDLMLYLHQNYKNNASYYNGLAHANGKLGRHYEKVGKYWEAWKYIQEKVTIMENLHKTYPDQFGYTYNLANAYFELGDFYAITKIKWSDSEDYYKLAINLFQNIHEYNPKIVRFTRNLALGFSRLGDFYCWGRDKEKGLEFYKKSLEISINLNENYPDQVSITSLLGATKISLASILTDVEGEMSKQLYNEALIIFEELIAKEPSNVNYQENFNFIKNKIQSLSIENK